MLSETHPVINNFQNLIGFANQNRNLLALIYLILISLLLFVQIIFLIKQFKLNPKFLFSFFALTTFFFSIAYPFLSYDMFSYLFTAKILMHYGLNPYLILPQEFMSRDLWISFIRNIDNTFNYGPVALIFPLIPMMLFSGSRFILNFLGLKLLNGLIFFLSGVLLHKLVKDHKILALWFLNPLLLVELLINSHNDLIMISFFYLAMVLLDKSKFFWGLLSFLASVLVKYISLLALPAIYLKENYRQNYLKFLSLGLFMFLQFKGGQVWYYSWIYMFLPFIKLRILSWVLICLIGFLLLVNYYNFIKSASWTVFEFIPFQNFLIYFCVGVIILIESNLFKKFKFLK